MITRIRTALVAVLIAFAIAFSVGALDGIVPAGAQTPQVLACNC